MRLNKLLEYIGIFNNDETEILALQIDSRKVKEGDVFLAFSGDNYDGNLFIDEAFNNGAIGIISDKYEGNRIYYYPKIKEERNRIAAYFYEEPFNNIKVIGITGTNGKTSSASCIYQVLTKLSKKAMLIGTNGVFSEDYYEELDNTTPDGVVLARLFNNAKALNCEYVIMEVSSHSIALKRISEVNFFGAIFTNISHEHLDFHNTIDNYAKTKSELFSSVNTNGFSIINSDDTYAPLMIKASQGRILTYGTSNCNYRINKCKLSRRNSEFMLNNTLIKTKLVSKFNVYNIVCCYLALKCLSFSDDQLIPCLEKIEPISGRVECIYQNGYSVFVDFAHTPDALKKVLSFIKPLCKGKLIALFGCGGERDQLKRPKMAEVVYNLADKVILTSDNPRHEDPQKIIDDAEKGFANKDKIECFISRYDAIRYINKIVANGDIVVLLGKGQEKYQIVKSIKVPYNDKEVFLKCLAKH